MTSSVRSCSLLGVLARCERETRSGGLGTKGNAKELESRLDRSRCYFHFGAELDGRESWVTPCVCLKGVTRIEGLPKD